MSSRPQGSYMFLKYTNTLMRTSIFALLQSRSCLGGSLLWILSLNTRFQWSPSTTSMAHHSLLPYMQYNPHIAVMQSQSKVTGTLLTALILPKKPILTFHLHFFVKGFFWFNSLFFSLLSVSFGGWPSLSTVILMIIFLLRWLFV